MVKSLSVVLLGAAIAGCAVGPDYKQPKMAAPAQFAAADAAYNSGQPIAEFWRAFGDPTLDQLMQRALTDNHDLRIALARLNEARALRREVQFDLFPTVTAQAAHTERLRSSDEIQPGTPRHSSLDSASFDAAWELDLFGRVRRAVEAGEASEQALRADLQAARVSVTAELARSYFELRGAQEQYAVAQRNAANQRETLALTQARLDAGRGTELDTERARAQFNATLATLPALDAAVENTIHRLSVLVGQPPNALRAQLRPAADLPALPRLVHIGTPEDLLRRRPDVRAAERRLAAATANIGVVKGDLFPRVSFTGEIGFVSDGLDRAGDSATKVYSYGPGISWAAFDLGRVEARIGQARAQAQGSLAAYQQTVLRALEETEDALVSYGHSRRQLDYLSASAAASGRAAHLARVRFEAGSSDFLDVLDAERVQLEADARLSQTRTAVATDLVALYKALGGSWEAGAQAQAANVQ